MWFADIVGYSRMSAQDAQRAVALVATLQDFARQAVDQHGGRIVKFVGDAVLAEFSSAAQALRSAHRLHDDFLQANDADDSAARLRIGLHVGEILEAEDGDIYGEGVNTASRIHHEAQPGQIVVSDDLRRHLRGHAGFSFQPIGRRSLRGLDAPIALYIAADPAAVNEPTGRLPGRVLHDLRRRGFTSVIAGYAAISVLALALLWQLVERETVDRSVLYVSGLWAIGGVPILATLGWFRWNSGRRAPRVPEALLLAGVIGALVVASAFVLTAAGPNSRSWALTGGMQLDPGRVAVLYLDDESEAGDYGYLADALTEDIIEALQNAGSLEVISRNGVAAFRDLGLEGIDSIARELEAGTIARGSLSRRTDHLRVNVQLMDGSTGSELTRAAFEAASPLDLSSDIAKWIIEHVHPRQRAYAESGRRRAWDLVQRAEELVRHGEQAVEREALDEAEALFERADAHLAEAEEADASWAEPSYLRGRIDYRRSRLAFEPSAALPWTEQALEHAEDALARDRDDAKALELRGTTRYWRYHLRAGGSDTAQTRLLQEARADLERAVGIDSLLASAFTTLAHLYYISDKPHASAEATRRAIEADAYLSDADVVLWRLFTSAYDLGQPDRASRWCADGRKRFPQSFRFSACGIHLMTMPGVSPDVERAWQLLEEVDSLSPPSRQPIEHAQTLLFVGGVIARAGLADSARAVFERARAQTPEEADEYQMAYIESPMRALAGDYDEALALLEFYLESEPETTASDFADHWWWHDLRHDAGFERIFAGR